MKKRFLAIVLTLVMALALAVPGFAASETRLTQETYENFSGPTSLVKVYHNGMYGYVNYAGQIVVHEKYTELHDFNDGLALAVKDNAVCYVDTTGREVITLGICEAHDFSNGLARIVEQGNTYFIDTTGKSVIMLGKTSASDFNSFGLAQIYRDGKIGLIDKSGNNVCHVVFDVMRSFSAEGLAYAEYTNAAGLHKVFINTSGAIAFELNNTLTVSDFSDGMAKVTDVNNQVGYVDVSGWLAVYCQYEEGDDFYNGVARIKRGGKWGYIDKLNKYTVQPEYDHLGSNAVQGDVVTAGKWVTETTTVSNPQFTLSDENHLVYQPGTSATNVVAKYGHVNVKTGAVVVPLQYHAVRAFSNGLAWVQLWGNQGFVDMGANVVINCGKYYDSVGDFHGGLAWVVKNGKWGYIGSGNGGALVIPMQYDVEDGTMYTNANFTSGVAVVRMASFSAPSRYGVINTAGQWIINPQYTSIDFFKTSDMVMLAQYGAVRTRILQLGAQSTATTTTPSTSTASSTTYTVKAGDTLGSISNAFYGSPSYYNLIYNANTDKLSNANVITPGQVLVIPAR